jgi:hypothetical protein
MNEMSAPIPCATCGWREEAHLFPDLYPQCAHEYVSQCLIDIKSTIMQMDPAELRRIAEIETPCVEIGLIDINRREVKPDHEPE